ncbi:MAG TPA: hypothetical protein VNI20_07130 [Fimbriimonadaceae bacterium]|nr:hypothetical protein [Fimbriimonadaceae bacterium]
MIAYSDFRDAALVLLDETFVGKPEGQDYTWIVEHEGGGLIDTLAALTANEASHKPTTDTNSIASHVNHLRQALAWTNAVIRGEPTTGDWEATWLVQTVDAARWDELRADLEREYRELREHGAQSESRPDKESMLGMMVVPAHALYHLGAIRQIMKSARAAKA